MSKNLGDLLSAASFFGALGHEIDRGSHEGLEKAAQVVEAEAKSALGTYRYGWPELAESTIARKTTGDSPLLETGGLRDSIQHVIEGKSAFIGSNSDIAEYQDQGTSRIPPRPIFMPAAIAKGAEIKAAIALSVIKAIDGA